MQEDETQSECFDVPKVSLHVSIVYCHAVELIMVSKAQMKTPIPLKSTS